MTKTKTGKGAAVTVEPPRLADRLEPGRIESDSELEAAVITGQDLSDLGIADASLDGCRVERCRLTGALFERLSLRDCEFVDCEMSGSFLKAMEAERVRFAACRMTGAVLSSAAMHHTRFVDCLMEGVNLRMFEGLVMAFDACEMREVDMYSGSLTNASFTGCDLTRADFSKLRLEAVRFAGGTLEGLRGPLALRGATLSSDLVLPLLPSLLSELKIVVEDEEGQSEGPPGQPATSS